MKAGPILLGAGILLTLVLAAVLVGGPPSAPGDGRPIVVVSVGPMATFVEKVAGDRVLVEVLVPPGASPVTHEPTIGQLQAVSRASVYVKVGHPNFPFERAWLDDLLAQNAGLTVVDGSAGIARREGDPHVWVSPGCVRVMNDNIAAALTEILPGEADALEAGRAAFAAEIDAVDADLRQALAGRTGRKFLVLHPAWGYLADEYGLVQVAIEDEHKEPGPHELAELIERARTDRIDVVFVQPQISRANADLIAGEIGGTVAIADPLARDWAANLRRVAAAFAGATGR